MNYIYWFLAKIEVPSEDIKLPQGQFDTATITSILQVVFGLAGAIALLIITRSGFRYITSQGEPQKIAKEKDSILYAIAGLVICILAFSIVSFVLGKVK